MGSAPAWLPLATLVPWLVAAPAGCARDAGRGLPLLTHVEGLDPFVLERIEAARGACERGEPGALLELAKVYDANGLHALALAGYEQCLRAAAPGDTSGRARLEFLRGQTLEALERPAEALAAFEAALALGDAYAPTHWRRGQLLFDFGRLDEARAAFTAALALEPHSIPAHLGMARLQLLAGDARGVLERLQPIAARAADERFVHGLLARAQRALGDEAAAASELAREERAQSISVADPRAAEVRTRATGVLVGLRRANDALVAGQPRAALEILDPLHARCPDDLALVQMLGKALVAAQEYERAIQVLEAGSALHPDQFKLELFLGLALEGKKAHKKALERLERARELNPAFGPTHAALGEVQTKFGAFAEAEASLARALEAGEQDLRTRLLLVQVQLEQKAWERALASAEQACAAFPSAAPAWTYLAEARARSGAAESARLALAEAEKRNPDYERLDRVRALLAPAGASPR